MSTKVFFINSPDAQYTDEEISWVQQLLLNEGVIGDPSSGAMGLGVTQNSPQGMSVLVPAGKALVELTKDGKTWKVVFVNDATATKTIASNSSGGNRVDAVIVRIDKDVSPNALKNNVGTIEVVTGTGASALSDGAIDTAVGNDGWLRLADVTVANNATQILTANIADTRTMVKLSKALLYVPDFFQAIAQSSDPASAGDGAIWYNSSEAKLKFKEGGATKTIPSVKFGGTGADGALSISSGTTTIDLAGAQVVIKNYSSISITGTGKLAFTNPHANGTIIILKSQGNVTLTSSTVPCIDVSGLGASANTNGIGNLLYPKGGANCTGSYSQAGVGGDGTYGSAMYAGVFGRAIKLWCGAGGGNGAASDHGGPGGGGSKDKGSDGGTRVSGVSGWPACTANFSGGRGGGCLMIECGGTLNGTGTIYAKGNDGQTPTGDANCVGASGAGGGGGVVVILYNALTANTLTININGGNGGTSAWGYTGGNGSVGYYTVAKNEEFA